jgi:hypothetical protein
VVVKVKRNQSHFLGISFSPNKNQNIQELCATELKEYCYAQALLQGVQGYFGTSWTQH